MVCPFKRAPGGVGGLSGRGACTGGDGGGGSDGNITVGGDTGDGTRQ